MDCITDLPPCCGFNGIYIFVFKLSKFVKLIPVSIGEGALLAHKLARLFFEHVVQLFSSPRIVLHDHDACFTANFWHCLGIVGFLGCIIIGLPSTFRWVYLTYSSDSGIGYPLYFILVGVT